MSNHGTPSNCNGESKSTHLKTKRRKGGDESRCLIKRDSFTLGLLNFLFLTLVITNHQTTYIRFIVRSLASLNTNVRVSIRKIRFVRCHIIK